MPMMAARIGHRYSRSALRDGARCSFADTSSAACHNRYLGFAWRLLLNFGPSALEIGTRHRIAYHRSQGGRCAAHLSKNRIAGPRRVLSTKLGGDSEMLAAGGRDTLSTVDFAAVMPSFPNPLIMRGASPQRIRTGDLANELADLLLRKDRASCTPNLKSRS